MADEDIGGIKIGLTADTTQLKAALEDADRLISGKAQNLRDRRITMHVYAKVDNATFGAIERDLNLVVKRAQERNAFKFRPVFEVTRGSLSEFNRGIARAAKERGGFKVPIVPEFDADLIRQALKGQAIPVPVEGKWEGWAADKMPEDFVLVKGIWDDWADGKGPTDVHVNGSGSNGSGGSFSSKDADRIIKAIRDCCAMGGGEREADIPDTGPSQSTQRQQQQTQAQHDRRREDTQRRWDERRERRRVDADARAARAAQGSSASKPAQKAAARETGEAVASKLQEEPVKTEKAPKEKAEEKARPAATSSTPRAAPSQTVEDYIARPNNQEAIRTGRATEASLRATFEKYNAPSARQPARATPDAGAGLTPEQMVHRSAALSSLVDPGFLRQYGIKGEAPTPEEFDTLIEKVKKKVEAGKGKQGPGSLIEARAFLRSGVTRADVEGGAEAIKQRRDALREARREAVATPAPEASAVAASPVAATPDVAKDLDAAVKATQQAQDDAIDVVLSNVEASALRMEEMPQPSPRPEVEAGKVLCPWCHKPYAKRGLASHIRQKHKVQTEDLTASGDFSREGMSRARTTMESGGIGERTPESDLLRAMEEERREIGVYDVGPDVERLIGTVQRDKSGRAQMNAFGRPIRQGGLLRKGLDPVAMRQGLIQPREDIPEADQQALLQDPEFISLRDDFYEAIEVRRSQLKGALAEELVKVAEDPERSERYLEMLQEAVADPAAEMGHQLGRKISRHKRRQDLGLGEEALTGFSRRDLIAALAPEGGQRPEGWEDLYQTYLQSELEASEKAVADTAELDKALLKHRTGGKGARQWDFGPDIQQLRDLRERAISMPGGEDFEGWLSHAVGRGMPTEAVQALREEVENTPVGERGDLIGEKIEKLRGQFGGPDPRLLEEVQRLASGPRFGEDIEGMEEGDPRRTGLLARIRRSVIKGANTPEAALRRLQTITDPQGRRTLKGGLRPREMELMEVAGFAAEASSLLDIFDQRRDTAQSTAQAAETKASNIEAGTGAAAPKPKKTKVKGTPSEIAEFERERDERIAKRKADREAGIIDVEANEAIQRALVEQARRELENERARPVEATPEPIDKESISVPLPAGGIPKRVNEPTMEAELLEEDEPTPMSAEDLDALQAARYIGEAVEPVGESYANTKAAMPSSCPCGWTGLAVQYKWHLPGDLHQKWKKGREAQGPLQAGGEQVAFYDTPGNTSGRYGVIPRATPPGGVGGPRYASGGGPAGMEGGMFCRICGKGPFKGQAGLAAHSRGVGHVGIEGVSDPSMLRGGSGAPEPPAIAHARAQAEAATAARIEAQTQTEASFAAMPGAARTAGLNAPTENITAEQAAEPAAQVAGQAATPPDDKRWCVVCKRVISGRGGAWKSHIGSRDHKAMLARGTEMMRGGFQDLGLPEPRGFEKIFKRRVEEAVHLPPPELGMAGSNMEGLDPASLKTLRGIAETPGGRRSLLGAGWSPEELEQLTQAESARSPLGGGGEGSEERIEGIPRRQAVLGRGGVATAVGAENFAGVVRAQRKEWSGILDLVQDQRNFAREVLEENPVRALSVAVGQVLVNLTGRAELKNTVGDIGRTASEVNVLAKEAQDVSERYQAALEGLASPNLDDDTREKLQRTVEELGGETGEGGVFGEIAGQFEEVAGVSLKRFQDIAKLRPRERRAATRQLEQEALAAEEAKGLGAEEPPETLMAQAARLRQARPAIAIRTALNATVGIVGGTALFTAAMTAFNVAMEHGAAWVGRVTDEMSGFAKQANVLAASLGQAAVPTGRTEGGIRERLGLAGIGGQTAEDVLGPIQDRVQGEVQAQRAILLRDTLALAQQSGRPPGIQNFAGNFQPTGGLVLPGLGQTNIGAQASVQETLAGAVGSIGQRTVPGGGPMLPFMFNPREIVDNFTGGALSKEIEQAQRREWDTVIGGWTDAMQRGGSEARFVSPDLEGMENQEELLRQQANALVGAGGAPDLALKVQRGEIAIVNENGDLVTSISEVGAALDALGQGLESVDLEQLLKAGARQLEAAFYGIAANLQNQLRIFNPQQTMMQLGAQPFMPFGAGVATSVLDPAFVAERAGISAGFRGQQQQRANQGLAATFMQATGGNPFNMLKQNEAGFSPMQMLSTFTQINAIGEQIVGWQTEIANMQLDQQMAEYNRQVFVAERNISDLTGLVHGVGDAHASNLGIMQQENLMRQRRIQDIQREGEAEQLNLNQRQINFSRALAGFTSSGATPAEAAARMKQAELEADFAQRQQDRQMEVFGITGEMIPAERQIVDEQNLRALQDALAEFGLMQDRFTLDQQTALIAANISDAQARQGALVQDMQAMIGALQQLEGVEVQMVQDAFTRGSETLQKTAEEVRGVYEEVAASFARSFDITITGTRNSSKGSGTRMTRSSSSGEMTTDAPGLAGGAFFNTTGTTGLIVGEAGTETVAVLRNPRRMLSDGGGGGVQININNPVVRDETDVIAIARAVEEVMNRRARMFGAGR